MKRKTLYPAISIVVMALLAGCQTVSEAGYFWGSYSQTLYQYTINPSDATLASHVVELKKILVQSDERGLKVPPGILAELGYITSKQGNDTEAMGYYEQEMQLYPESRAFLERLNAKNTEETSK
jgi:hypothetical protein